MIRTVLAMGLIALLLAAAGCGGGGGEVRRPEFVRNLAGQTSWFASPIVADLDGDGKKELIAAYYSIYAFSPDGGLIDRADGNGSRIYAPHVVVDLEGDGTVEIVCGQGRQVYAYEWRDRHFSVKSGWPRDTTCAGSSPEVRGLAAADLDGNGSIEIIATTTQTLPTDEGGSQVYVWSFNGDLYQPEIMVQSFDHGMDVFTVPDSGCDCLLWTTARGGPLRMGQPSGVE